MQHKDELQNEISNIKLKILKEEGERNKLKEEFENAEKTVNSPKEWNYNSLMSRVYF